MQAIFEVLGRGCAKEKQRQKWSNLPGDVLLRLARPLSIREKAVIERVCKDWHTVPQHAQVRTASSAFLCELIRRSHVPV